MKATDTMRAARALIRQSHPLDGQQVIGTRFLIRRYGRHHAVPVTIAPARFQPAVPEMPVRPAAVCCVCGTAEHGGRAFYENYRGQLFCPPCADRGMQYTPVAPVIACDPVTGRWSYPL